MNDTDEGIVSSLLKFADDANIPRKVVTQGDCDELQNDLHKMYKSSVDWQMVFNIGKCKCLDIGHGNSQASY